MSKLLESVALPCTRVPDGVRPGNALRIAEPIRMGQGWRDEEDEGLRAGTVRLAWEPGALWVMAELVDDEIWSTATADSQRLWEMGDVFEMFLQVEGRDDYVEMHVAPHGFRMHLRLDTEMFRAMANEEREFDGALVRPPAFEAKTLVLDGQWVVEARVPASEVHPNGRISPGDRWLASFCRYDARAEGSAVLSSTSPHRICGFHRRAEWRSICF
ncbi:MAG: hypothetical protein SFU53_03605 [Terrimicrobiaceae bacterium]|nr:hypothetical protein [Terrimicrobiaceae bacterium]